MSETEHSATAAAAEAETHGFQSEIPQLLDLMINSLYSHPEIFLRELISNAADAIDKLKFEALSDEALFEGDADPRIDIEVDTEAKAVTIRDNGIGMTRDEVVENLGTIAKSGTREFFSSLTGEAAHDSELIGQFGVGFYSAFIVAQRVEVVTRKAGAAPESGVRWVSDGKADYTIESRECPLRGTEITLFLKEEHGEFADAWRLRSIVRKYSDHISAPIRMDKEGAGEGGGDDAEGDEAISAAPEKETINKATALWTRNKKDISDEEYQEFYKHISHDFSEPLRWTHNRVEGKLEYTSLLYLPARAPFDLWDREVRRGVKLYVQRVFILENAEELMPRYLRFVRGIVDTNDLPLNVSRELLQSSKAIDSIKTASTKRVLDMLVSLSETDDYAAFWAEFGAVLKEGLVEDHANQEKLAGLLRFSTTREDAPEPAVSLADYLGRMKDDQDAIYYLTGESFATVKNSPHLEAFRARDIEVLLLSDPVDEWWVGHLTEYEGKPLKSAASSAVDVGDDGDAQEADEDSGELTGRIGSALGDKVASVAVSRRLTSSPACLVAGEHDISANLERILRASGQEVPETKRILEINPAHPILKMLADETDDDKVKRWSELLYEQSVLAEGGRLDDPAGFVQRVNEMFVTLKQPG